MRPEEHPAKIRALIVDDEPLARTNIAVLLRHDPEIGVVGECGSGQEALGEIRVAKPDLLFLDVQMPECDGFDVLELLGSDLPSAIIFVTAYDQYALRAFAAGALDYLLKPFDNSRFELALGRAKQESGSIEVRTIGAKTIDQNGSGRQASGVGETLANEIWSASSSRAREKFASSKSPRSIGSRRPTTTRACTSDRRATCYAEACRTWRKTSIQICFAVCTGRAS